MVWQATLTINNNTDYNIDVVHNNPQRVLTTLIPGQSSWNWDTSDNINNTITLNFWQQQNNIFLQSSVSFGPEAGVYADRGWMSPDTQTIELRTHMEGTLSVQSIQTENGGEELLTVKQFSKGGTIELTFNNI